MGIANLSSADLKALVECNEGETPPPVIDTKNRCARRCLFTPDEQIENEANKDFVKRLLDELAEQRKFKWDFDFIEGRPLSNSTLEKTFEYISLAADDVPQFYRTHHCSSNIVGSPSKLTNPDGNLHTDGNKRYEYNGKENALLPPYLENGDQLANIRSSTLNKSSQNKPKRNPMITTPKRKGKENRLNQILLSAYMPPRKYFSGFTSTATKGKHSTSLGIGRIVKRGLRSDSFSIALSNNTSTSTT